MGQRLALHGLWIATALGLLLPSAADPDLWGHLLFGSMLLDGTLPATNSFAYTAAAHPWVNHELLAEGTMAAVFSVAGAAGLVALKVLLGLASLAIVWRTAARRSGHAWAAALATTCAALVMAPGFMIRPQLFTLVGLAIMLEALAASDYRVRGPMWMLPLVAAIWVNTHGGVLAGVALTTLALGAALAARAWRGEVRAREVVATAAFVAALGGALVLNPYGVDLPRFLAFDVTPRVGITEWKPIALDDLSFPLFKAIVLALAVWTVLRRRVSVAELAVVVAAAGAALLHRRHIPLFAITAAPLVAALLADVTALVRGRFALDAAEAPLRRGLVAVTVLQVLFAIATAFQVRGGIWVDPNTYPIQALRFMEQNEIRGNIALPFDWGEYGLWCLSAGSRVAVDGRFTTAYPQGLLEDAWRFMSGEPGWEALLERYPTDVVIADRRQAPAQLLRDHPEWQYVYSDPLSLIFIRRVPSQAETLARFDAGLFRFHRELLNTDFPAATRQAANGTAALARATAAHTARDGGVASDAATTSVEGAASTIVPPS